MPNTWSIIFLAKDDSAARFKIENSEKRPLSFREVFMLWRDSEEFISFYVKELIALGFEEMFWEHPAVNKDFLDKSYEVIVLHTSHFKNRRVDERSFSQQIESQELVAIFPNLGRNATLVVPTRQSEAENYKQLGSFIRHAPPPQILAQFKALGTTLLVEANSDKLVWLNTAGLGVIWLHMRLDERPKYYKIKTYKNPDFLVGK